MPALSKLSLTHFRNISSASIELSAGFNLFCGKNGSGKSSILEAVHVLGMGRSFRSSLQKPLVQDGHKETTLYCATTEGRTIGITRPTRGIQILKLDHNRAQNVSELAHTLPLQLLNSDTFKVLEGSPGERRRFLDWGVFHVEQLFFDHWRAARRALQNRNNLLKNGANSSEIEPWTLELAKHAEAIDHFRATYIKQLDLSLNTMLAVLLDVDSQHDFEMIYQRGWDHDTGLLEQLNQNLSRDRKYGYTTAGPQRADLKFRTRAGDAAEILSRGQQKLLISALKIAQGAVLFEQTGNRCLYLIDDLPAELDIENRQKVCELLAALQCQVLISSIEAEAIEMEWLGGKERASQNKLFHVKHGKITTSE